MKLYFPTWSCLAAALLISRAPAQTPTPASPSALPAPAGWLQLLDTSSASAQTLAPNLFGIAPDITLVVDVEIDGESLSLWLRPNDIRSNNYELLVDDGTTISSVEPATEDSWAGEILDEPGSRVVASYDEVTFRALLQRADSSELLAIQPARDVVPTAAPDRHLIHSSADAISHGHRCGVIDPPVPSTNAPSTGEDSLRIAQLALEADFELFQQLGGTVPGVESYLLNLISMVNMVYERDVDLRHQVSTILVRTAPGPYTATNAIDLLGQFSSWWNTNRTGTPRAMAHLCAGRTLSGPIIGIANSFSACNTFIGYGLSELSFSPNLTQRVGLVAHELGHCWGAGHCDGDADCSLMCATLGRCTGPGGTFGSRSRNSITSFASSVGCLTSPPPSLISVLPGGVPSLITTPIQLIGESLSDVTALEVDGQPLGSRDFTVIDDTRIDFTPPTPTSLGNEQIQAFSPAGSSNTLSYPRVGNDPPVLTGPTITLGGLPLQISAGAQPNRAVFLFGNVNDPNPLPLFGFNFISSPILLRSGLSDTVGRFDQVLNPPFGLRSIDLRLQLVALDGAGTLIDDVSVPLLVEFF